MKSFNELSLPAPLSRAIQALGYEQPTPIQAQAIPVALTGQDLIGIAQTGTGKTAAFAIPLITHLLGPKAVPNSVALVLAPTRELAQQIESSWKGLTKFLPELRCAVLIGGVAMGPQERALRNRPRLIIATPGRLLDHLARGTVRLGKVADFLVLDEADRMLDMGFEPQLRKVLQHLPKERQSLLFSATWDNTLDRLAQQYLADPARIAIGTVNRAATLVEQSIVKTTAQQKNTLLLDQINAATQGSILVFARTQHRTDRVAKYLNSYGLQVHRIHGGRSQGQRNTALNSFRSGETRILVATDIAARGIDVNHIEHVINYDLPQQPEDYIHRIGRTGRAGASGQAISFVTPEDKGQWNEIVRLLKKSGSPVPVA